jgi:hypothetical protein
MIAVGASAEIHVSVSANTSRPLSLIMSWSNAALWTAERTFRQPNLIDDGPGFGSTPLHNSRRTRVREESERRKVGQ